MALAAAVIGIATWNWIPSTTNVGEFMVSYAIRPFLLVLWVLGCGSAW